MSVTKITPSLRKIPVPAKAPKLMIIRNRQISKVEPKDIEVTAGESVELRADDDCEVVFDLGFGLILKQNHSQLIMFPESGDYHFEVQYLVSAIQASTDQTVPAPCTTTNVIATQTMFMAASAMSGPVGDIHVP